MNMLRDALITIRNKAVRSAAAAREGATKLEDPILRAAQEVYAEQLESLAIEAAEALGSSHPQ